MTPSRRSVLLLLGAAIAALIGPADSHVLSSTEDSEVRVVSNPHCSGGSSADTEHVGGAPEKVCSASSSSCEPQLLLSPHRIIRIPMATQHDTLVEVTTKKILSVPVPIYHFRQPARLSHLELPFQLVLVSDIDVGRDGLHEIPVDPVQASDSWFPGYSWTPVACISCNRPVHVGWKFAKATGGEFFYALIVDTKKEEKDRVQVGIGALGEAIADTLQIGTRAPAWMIDALTKIV